MKDPGEILLFQTEDGGTRIDVRLVGETVWLPAVKEGVQRIVNHHNDFASSRLRVNQPGSQS